ncbi:MAG: hypothetical protein AAFP70_01610 [Calditrichota bacterium]
MQQLSKAEIKYVVIGTWALKKKYPEDLAGYPVKDCDLIIAPLLRSIRQTIAVLVKNNWSVTVWEEEIDDTVEMNFLQGKFYLRARKSKLTLDITYECPFIPWQELMRDKQAYSGIPLASTKHILHLKELKGTDRDKHITKLFRSTETAGLKPKL